MVWIAKNLRDHLVLTPLSWACQGCHSLGEVTHPAWPWTLPEMGHPQPVRAIMNHYCPDRGNVHCPISISYCICLTHHLFHKYILKNPSNQNASLQSQFSPLGEDEQGNDVQLTHVSHFTQGVNGRYSHLVGDEGCIRIDIGEEKLLAFNGQRGDILNRTRFILSTTQQSKLFQWR